MDKRLIALEKFVCICQHLFWKKGRYTSVKGSPNISRYPVHNFCTRNKTLKFHTGTRFAQQPIVE